MKIPQVQTVTLLLISVSLSACNASKETPRGKVHAITVAAVQEKAVTIAQPYVCQVKSHHRIEVRSPEAGSVGEIKIREGQMVKKGDLLFQIKPRKDKENQDAENEFAVLSINAPFDGVIGSLPHPHGSFVRQSEALTTLSDNSSMWVYFNVPEARYLEYKSANLEEHKDDLKIELVLANGNTYDQLGKLGAIGAHFKDGTVAFRADFPNPERVLRHGQTATLLINQVQNDAIVVPQQATFEVLDKRYVYVVDKDKVVHRREIVVQNEFEDLFVVKSGVAADDKIVIDGVRQISDGDKVQYEDRQPKKVVVNPK